MKNNSKFIIKMMQYKILVLGNKDAGKTSLCKKFCSNEFDLEKKPSCKSETFSKQLQIYENKIKMFIVIYDMKTIIDNVNIQKDVSAAIIIYDITKYNNFEEIELVITNLRKYNPKLPILILGNKLDLEFLRKVDSEEAKEKAEELNCIFAENMCTDSQSVKNSFKLLLTEILIQYYHDESENEK